jgi:hypothetical protein
MLDHYGCCRPELRKELQKEGHCSALIKVTGDFSDLFQAHSSWFEYADTNRIFKSYHFAFNVKTGANRISFSSYPGYVISEGNDVPVQDTHFHR